MASAVIHLCVAKEVNKYLNMDEKYILLGSIAPDIAKQVGQTKEISHFLDHTNEDDIPNIDKFLAKYNGLEYELLKLICAHWSIVPKKFTFIKLLQFANA